MGGSWSISVCLWLWPHANNHLFSDTHELSLYPSPSLSLFLKYTHALHHSHTHFPFSHLVHTLSLSLSHTHRCLYTHYTSLFNSLTFTRTLSLPHAHTHRQILTHSLSLSFFLSHSHTHTHTYKHTHALPIFLFHTHAHHTHTLAHLFNTKVPINEWFSAFSAWQQILDVQIMSLKRGFKMDSKSQFFEAMYLVYQY